MSRINEIVKVKLQNPYHEVKEVKILTNENSNDWFVGEVISGSYSQMRLVIFKHEILQEKVMLTAKEAKELADKAMLPKRLEQISYKIKLQAEKGCYSLFIPEREMLIKTTYLTAEPYKYKVVSNDAGYIISWE